MFQFLRKHRTILFSTLAFCIIGMLFFGAGGSSLMSSPQDTIMKVNGRKIKQIDFDRIYNQLVRQKNETQLQDRTKLNQEAMNELIRMEVFDEEARKYDIRVSDQELQLMLASTAAFQKEGKFDPSTYVGTLRQALGVTPAEFEAARKKEISARKVNQIIASAVQVPDSIFESELQNQLATETDKKKKKELMENPEKLREEIRGKEVNLVFQDWLSQLNSNLKINIVSENFKKRLAAPPPAAPSAPSAPAQP